MKVNQKKLVKAVEDFNATYKVGDSVLVERIKGRGNTFTDTIKHKAAIMGRHTPVTWLRDKGSYNLTHVLGKA
jgi:hypothetical protein